MRCWLTGLAMALLALSAGSLPAAGQTAESGSGLDLPRYVSLKADRVNVRKGPGTDYPIAWVFERIGLPVEVIKEYESWRQIRDSDGAEGWVLQNLLSARRTALVAPWEARKAPAGKTLPVFEVRESASGSGGVVAKVEAGALVSVLSCDRTWCLVSVSDQRGYLEQAKLWGVYKDESLR